MEAKPYLEQSLYDLMLEAYYYTVFMPLYGIIMVTKRYREDHDGS